MWLSSQTARENADPASSGLVRSWCEIRLPELVRQLPISGVQFQVATHLSTAAYPPGCWAGSLARLIVGPTLQLLCFSTYEYIKRTV